VGQGLQEEHREAQMHHDEPAANTVVEEVRGRGGRADVVSGSAFQIVQSRRVENTSDHAARAAEQFERMGTHHLLQHFHDLM
jgi:hypothetical protein